MSNPLNRRRFIKAAAASAAFVAPAIRASGQAPPSARVRLGLIGCGGRGRQLLSVLSQYADVEVPVVSDVIESRMPEAAKVLAQNPGRIKPDQVVEHERILDRRDVDAVLVATTQHWHGLPFIQAVQAGKHVFVEKPFSYSVAEGRAMVDAAKKSELVALMGTQQRGYPHYLQAFEIVRSGRLGKIALVECWNNDDTGRRAGRSPDGDPPAGLHWDRWLGPAPYVPFNPARLRNTWWFDYSGGMLTNWAIHHIDTIYAALGMGWPDSIVCAGGKLVVDDMADTPDTVQASWRFSDFVMHYSYRGFNAFRRFPHRHSSHGIAFFGSEGTMLLDRKGFEFYRRGAEDSPAESVANARSYGDGKPGNEVDGPWQRLFIDCIQGKKAVPVDVEQSHRATACCHLANIAYRVGRSIRWDAGRETIPGDPQAAALLGPPRRRGYELPAV